MKKEKGKKGKKCRVTKGMPNEWVWGKRNKKKEVRFQRMKKYPTTYRTTRPATLS